VPADWQTRLRGYVFADSIGHGVTTSQPFVVGMMTQLLAASKRSSVLEIGTGSGYQAAVLAQLAGLGYANVTVRQGDGYLGWPGRAPFDRLILTAAPPEVPQALLDQLACGGRLVATMGGAMQLQDLVAIDKTPNCVIRTRTVTTVQFVPMVHGRDGKR